MRYRSCKVVSFIIFASFILFQLWDLANAAVPRLMFLCVFSRQHGQYFVQRPIVLVEVLTQLIQMLFNASDADCSHWAILCLSNLTTLWGDRRLHSSIIKVVTDSQSRWDALWDHLLNNILNGKKNLLYSLSLQLVARMCEYDLVGADRLSMLQRFFSGLRFFKSRGGNNGDAFVEIKDPVDAPVVKIEPETQLLQLLESFLRKYPVENNLGSGGQIGNRNETVARWLLHPHINSRYVDSLCISIAKRFQNSYLADI